MSLSLQRFLLLKLLLLSYDYSHYMVLHVILPLSSIISFILLKPPNFFFKQKIHFERSSSWVMVPCRLLLIPGWQMEGAEPDIFGVTVGLGVYQTWNIMEIFVNVDSIIEIHLSIIVPSFFSLIFHMFTFQKSGIARRLGVQWSSLSQVGPRMRDGEMARDTMGMSWCCHGLMYLMTIFHGNFMEISWKFHGNFME